MPVAIAAALGIAGLGFFIYAVMRPLPPDQQQVDLPSDAAREQPVAAVTALGRLEPQGGVIQVAAPTSSMSSVGGRVARILVREGDRVEAGQVIAIMDSGERLQAAVVQAEAQVQEAQSRLVQVQAGAKPADIDAERANVDRLQAELQNAQREYARYLSLYEDGAISASELEGYQLRVVTVTRDLERAQQVLASVRQVRPVDVRVAESQVQVAIANLQQAQAELGTAAVRSPIDGQVIRINTDPGEDVGTNGIMDVGYTDQMVAVAEVYETDISRIEVGQSARITSSAFAGELTGVVEQVGLLIDKNDVLDIDPTADTDARVVEVKIRLDDSELVAGLTNLQVDVAIALRP